MVDFDDFKEADDKRKRERFDSFKKTLDRVLKEDGSDKTADDILRQGMGMKPKEDVHRPSAWERIMEDAPDDAVGLSAKLVDSLRELRETTTDQGIDEIILRAVGLYRSIVRHTKAGGTVQFVDEDGEVKTLKVRLK